MKARLPCRPLRHVPSPADLVQETRHALREPVRHLAPAPRGSRDPRRASPMTPPGPARRAALLALAASFGWASGPGGPVPPAWAQSPQSATAGSPLSQAPLSQAPPSAPLSQAQLEQLLAPIALYPD